MADLEKTVKIIFEGEDKQLTAAIGNIAGKFDQISGAADSLAAPLAKAADGILKMDAALAALAIGGMALSIKKAGEFENSFEEITTLISDTGENVKKFERDILDYAATSGKSLADINQAIYNAISAGVDYKDSIAFLSVAEKLAIAGRAELGTTTKTLISILNAYGESTDKAGKYSDILFQTVRLGQTTMEELSGSMAQVVAIAAGAGVPFETVTAAIAAMTAQGMPTEQAVTALKGAITSIISPTTEAAQAAAGMGIEFGASALKTRGLEAVLKDVMKATGGNIETLNALFGNVRGLSGVLSLATESSARFSKNLYEMQNAAGATAVAYAKVADGFDNINQRIVNNMDIMLVEVGQKMMGFYKDTGGALADIFKGIKAAVDAGAFDPLFDMLDEAGKGLSEWLAGVAKAFPEAMKDLDFSSLIDALKSLGGVIGDYFGDLDLTDVEDLHGFIQKIIDGIAGLIKITSGMVEGFRPFFEAIKGFLLSVANSDDETQKMMGTLMALGKMINSTSLAFVAAITAIDKYGVSIEGAFKTITGGAQVMWNGLQILANAIQMLFIVLEKGFLGFIDLLSLGLLGKFNQAFKDMQATVEQTGMDLRESFIKNGMDASRGFDKMIDGFEKLGQQAGKTAQEVKEANQIIADIPEEKVTTWKFEGAEEIKAAILDIGKEVVNVEAAAAAGIKVGVQTELQWETVEIVTEGLKKIPDEIKVEVTLETAKLKEQSSLIQKAMEWKAKIDISAAEEATKQLKTMVESVNEGIRSTGDLLGDLVGQLGETKTRWTQDIILDQIKAERKMREEELALQKELIESQTEYTRAKTEALQSGQDFLIKIEATGLEPHIEAFMWKILENIQVRGNAQAAEFLLGWNAAAPATP